MSIFTYFSETRNELKHIVWPSRTKTIALTSLVIILAVLVAYFQGLFDLIFTKLLTLIIN